MSPLIQKMKEIHDKNNKQQFRNQKKNVSLLRGKSKSRIIKCSFPPAEQASRYRDYKKRKLQRAALSMAITGSITVIKGARRVGAQRAPRSESAARFSNFTGSTASYIITFFGLANQFPPSSLLYICNYEPSEI